VTGLRRNGTAEEAATARAIGTDARSEPRNSK
jgi:hypothetical protein